MSEFFRKYNMLFLVTGITLLLISYLIRSSVPVKQYPSSDYSCPMIEEIHFSSHGMINVNTEETDDLTSIKGIGEHTAYEWMQERKINGPFYYPEDLLSIKGIGQKTLQKILPELEF